MYAHKKSAKCPKLEIRTFGDNFNYFSQIVLKEKNRVVYTTSSFSKVELALREASEWIELMTNAFNS